MLRHEAQTASRQQPQDVVHNLIVIARNVGFVLGDSVAFRHRLAILQQAFERRQIAMLPSCQQFLLGARNHRVERCRKIPVADHVGVPALMLLARHRTAQRVERFRTAAIVHDVPVTPVDIADGIACRIMREKSGVAPLPLFAPFGVVISRQIEFDPKPHTGKDVGLPLHLAPTVIPLQRRFARGKPIAFVLRHRLFGKAVESIAEVPQLRHRLGAFRNNAAKIINRFFFVAERVEAGFLGIQFVDHLFAQRAVSDFDKNAGMPGDIPFLDFFGQFFGKVEIFEIAPERDYDIADGVGIGKLFAKRFVKTPLVDVGAEKPLFGREGRQRQIPIGLNFPDKFAIIALQVVIELLIVDGVRLVENKILNGLFDRSPVFPAGQKLLIGYRSHKQLSVGFAEADQKHFGTHVGI